MDAFTRPVPRWRRRIFPHRNPHGRARATAPSIRRRPGTGLMTGTSCSLHMAVPSPSSVRRFFISRWAMGDGRQANLNERGGFRPILIRVVDRLRHGNGWLWRCGSCANLRGFLLPPEQPVKPTHSESSGNKLTKWLNLRGLVAHVPCGSVTAGDFAIATVAMSPEWLRVQVGLDVGLDAQRQRNCRRWK